jgi:two-component system CheB/CheR fusion protein
VDTKENKKKIVSAAVPEKNKKFPVVAIGASAGGLEAVTALLKNISPDTGMAFVFVQHLDPHHESMLTPILSKVTGMKVVEAENMMKMEPNHFYVIPPNKELFAVDSILKVKPRPDDRYRHMPIDSFFISLAQEEKERAIGIVLSGAATDGTAGLKAIRIAGGLTLAQDETAKFKSMPQSAVREGVVDLILSPKDMAAELESLARNMKMLQAEGTEEEDTISDDNEDLIEIIHILKKFMDVDFSHYKMNTIKRRIIRRMLIQRMDNLHSYAQFIRKNPDEVNILYKDLLINVTSFFRDKETVDYLKKELLPQLVKSKSKGDTLRIWVPACATGEEVYSLCILLLETMEENKTHIPVQIFGTDLSPAAINKARLGVYSKADVENVLPHRLQHFFTKENSGYRINKTIRDMCVFATHDVFKDPPFSRIDLVSCCNLLIYLDMLLQRRIMSVFHYSLNDEGTLILGKSESIGGASSLFSLVDKKVKIYKRKKNTDSRRFEIANVLDQKKQELQLPHTKSGLRKFTAETEVGKAVEDLLLSQYTPPCVLVNNDMEIIQFRGSTSLFLEPASGKASLNLFKMARPGLGFELRNAIHKSGKTGKVIKKNNIEIEQNGTKIFVNIEVLPFKVIKEPHFLVVMQQAPTKLEKDEASPTREKKILKLEKELMAVREDMRSIIAQGEIAYEELQSANEEIVSSNEELQSINEELQTSKEELESTNEELITVNHELNSINDQLTEAHEYNLAVLNTMHEAMLVLDKDLRIKLANNSFHKIFDTNEDDTLGKLLFDLGNGNWNLPRLRELLLDVVPKNSVFKDFEVVYQTYHRPEKTFLLNAQKLDLRKQNEELILLAFQDVTAIKRGAKLNAQRDWYRNMADNVPVMIWLTDTNLFSTYFNETWLEYTGRRLEQELGNGWKDNIHPDDLKIFMEKYSSAMEKRVPFSIEYRLRKKDGAYRWVMSTGKPLFSPDKDFVGYIGSCQEIPHQEVAVNK